MMGVTSDRPADTTLFTLKAQTVKNALPMTASTKNTPR
jgi:hypothetical protein